jgi:hypothetical protein
MPNDDLADLLRSLGVRVSREALLALIAHATTARLSPVQAFEEIVGIARRERDQRNLAARTKAATIGTFKPLDRFDWNHPRTIPRELIEELCTLDFVAKGHNVLLRGPSGVGKTMLAQNLAMLALEHGHTVRFTDAVGGARGSLEAGVAARSRAAPAQVHRAFASRIGRDWISPVHAPVRRPALQHHQSKTRKPLARADHQSPF